jgi:hypothetical protein
MEERENDIPAYSTECGVCGVALSPSSHSLDFCTLLCQDKWYRQQAKKLEYQLPGSFLL